MIDKLDAFGQDLDALVANKPAQQVAPQAPVEQPEQPEPQEQPKPEVQAQPEQEESFQARNFRELRTFTQKVKAEKERLAKENEELRKYLMAAQGQTPQQHQAAEPEEYDLGSDDEIAEKKDVKKVYKTAKQAIAEQKKLQAQLYAMQVEREIEKELPDYYQVVTPETVSALRDLDADMAQVIASYPDLKVQAKAAYKAIKAAGLHKMAEYETPKKLIEQNKQRPPSVPTVAQQGGESPLGRAMDYYAGDLTEQMKKQFYMDMKKAQMGR